VAIAGFVLAWSLPNLAVVTTGLFFVGLGISLNWPLGISRAVQASGGLATQATSWASFAGGIALAIVPFTLGASADAIGIHAAFTMLPALLIIATVILFRHPRT